MRAMQQQRALASSACTSSRSLRQLSMQPRCCSSSSGRAGATAIIASPARSPLLAGGAAVAGPRSRVRAAVAQQVELTEAEAAAVTAAAARAHEQHEQHEQQQQQQQQQQQASTSGQQRAASSSPAPPSSALGGRVARFAARKTATRAVPARGRPLAEYMALPASQYSVLDARRVERIDDETFRCYVGKLSFLSLQVEPVIEVSVAVEARGCTIRLLSARLQGSPAIEDVNRRFTAGMTNVVRWHDAAASSSSSGSSSSSDGSSGSDSSSSSSGGGPKGITSDTSIEVVVQVPAWAGLLPVASIEAAGSGVMQQTLNLMVPRFLAQLETDYERWAAGGERLQEGSLSSEE